MKPLPAIVALLCVLMLIQGAAAEPSGYYLLVSKTGATTATYTSDSIAVDLTPTGLYYETIILSMGQTATFTQTRLGGETVTGSISVQPGGLLGESANKTITIDGVTHSASCLYIPYLTLFSFTFIGAMNTTTNQYGYMVYDNGDNGNFAFSPASSIKTNTIYLTAIVPDTGQVTAQLYFGTSANYGAYAGPEVTGDIIDDFLHWANEIKDFVIEFVVIGWFVFTGALYWFKFFFVDNALLVVVLVEGGGLAYAACTSRNVFEFFKRAWALQMTIFGLFMWFMERVSQVLGYIKQIIWPV
jgi:hypothetical protein